MNNPRVYDGFYYWVWRNPGDRIRHQVDGFVNRWTTLTWGRVNRCVEPFTVLESRWEGAVNQ